MQEAFRLGGWGMYPTTIFGLVLMIAAIRYASNPGRPRLNVVFGLGALTLLSSWLGFVSGLINTTVHAGALENADDRSGTVIVGFGESLNNVGLGIGLLIMASLAVVAGLARASSRSNGRSDLVDPM